MDDRLPGAVVVGASAGGIEALKTVVDGLPADLPAAVAVVVHVTPTAESFLPHILARAGALPAVHARDGDPLEAGRIYVAPPDRHLLLRDGRCVVARGPREHHLRPAIDPLFRSAAVDLGPRVVGVVLSGTRTDGVAGARAIAARGGKVVVQDPADAAFPEMPATTIVEDHPDRVVPLAEIARTVVEIVESLSSEVGMSDNDHGEMNLETSYAALDAGAMERPAPPGEPSAYSCPACGGVLWELDDGELLRFRCRVGHAYTGESALDDQADSVEAALWASLRALREREQLAARVAARLRSRGHTKSVTRFEEIASEASEQAETIRRVLLERDDAGG